MSQDFATAHHSPNKFVATSKSLIVSLQTWHSTQELNNEAKFPSRGYWVTFIFTLVKIGWFLGVCSKVWVLSPIGISNQHVSESIWSMFSPCILGNLKLPRTFHERSEQLPRPCWMNAPQGAGGVLLRRQEGDMVINAIPHNLTSKQVNAKHFLSCILATG